MRHFIPFSMLVLFLLTPLVLHSQNGHNYSTPDFIQTDRIERVKQVDKAVHQLYMDHRKRNKIPGIAYGVLVDDSLVLASACGLANLEQGIPATTSTRFRIASMSKSFTAMAILMLRDDGRLFLDDSASRYIPEMDSLIPPTIDSPPILVRNLLSMTAGFPEDNPWGDRQLDESEQMLGELISGGLSFSTPTGTAYEYSNTGYAILGLIITRVSGMPYQEYIRQNIFLPLGMENSTFEFGDLDEEELALGYGLQEGEWILEPLLHDGAFGAMGGILTTIEDFSRYMSFHLQAWPPRDERDEGPVKRSTLREMHNPDFPRLESRATDIRGKPCARMIGYGYGLRIDRYCDGLLTISHGGALPGFGSKFYLFPEYGVGIMAFGNLTYTGPLPFDRLSSLLLDSAALQARVLPPNDLQVNYQHRINQLIRSWVSESKSGVQTVNASMEHQLVAENFYQDQSRESRKKEFAELFARTGEILEMDQVHPENQLRGNYVMHAENGRVIIEFTLTPESIPRLQYLEGRFSPNRKNPADISRRP